MTSPSPRQAEPEDHVSGGVYVHPVDGSGQSRRARYHHTVRVRPVSGRRGDTDPGVGRVPGGRPYPGGTVHRPGRQLAPGHRHTGRSFTHHTSQNPYSNRKRISLGGDIKILSLQSQTFHKSSHNHLKGSVTQLVTFADVSQNGLCIHYIVIRYPKQIVQMAFCDLSYTYHKQVTSVSPACFCHPTVGNFDVSPWLHNANEIDTNNMKLTCPTQTQCTQHGFTAVRIGSTRLFPYQHVDIGNPN